MPSRRVGQYDVRESNPSPPVESRGYLTRSRTSRPSERLAGVEPTCPPWRGGASAARPRALLSAEGEGVEPSRALSASAAFEAAAIAGWLALPFLPPHRHLR